MPFVTTQMSAHLAARYLGSRVWPTAPQDKQRPSKKTQQVKVTYRDYRKSLERTLHLIKHKHSVEIPLPEVQISQYTGEQVNLYWHGSGVSSLSLSRTGHWHCNSYRNTVTYRDVLSSLRPTYFITVPFFIPKKKKKKMTKITNKTIVKFPLTFLCFLQVNTPLSDSFLLSFLHNSNFRPPKTGRFRHRTLGGFTVQE